MVCFQMSAYICKLKMRSHQQPPLPLCLHVPLCGCAYECVFLSSEICTFDPGMQPSNFINHCSLPGFSGRRRLFDRFTNYQTSTERAGPCLHACVYVCVRFISVINLQGRSGAQTSSSQPPTYTHKHLLWLVPNSWRGGQCLVKVLAGHHQPCSTYRAQPVLSPHDRVVIPNTRWQNGFMFGYKHHTTPPQSPYWMT